jgi:hypothetical protein
MTKNYHAKNTRAATLEAEIAVPETVSVAMAELAANFKEGLLALAVGAGLQVMHALIDEGVTGVCGPRGRHDRLCRLTGSRVPIPPSALGGCR